MKNIASLSLSLALLAGTGFGISSCKDDEPPAKPKLSFAETEMTVAENAGTIEIEVVIDKPHSKDLTIEYELGGTASDQDVVGTANADYEVVGDHGVVVIEAGETTGVIELSIYSDAAFEADETIEISFLDTNTDEIEMTADDDVVITITNDDAQLVATVGTADMTVNESDGINGLLEITVQLSQAPASDVTIEYTLEGTAIDSAFAANYEPEAIPAAYYDYKVLGPTSGQLVIPAGSTSAKIQIQIFTDFMFEGDETIELALTETNAVQLGADSGTTITIQQQDGKIIALLWNETYTDVDMDMFLWIGESVDNLSGIIASAITPRATPQQELIMFPSVLFEDVNGMAFGLSHTYYEGTANPMAFEVHFIDYAAGVVEDPADRDVYAASYTTANINPWYESQVDPVVVQTFRIVDGAFVEISEITVPASGSRMRSQPLPDGLEKRMWIPSKPL